MRQLSVLVFSFCIAIVLAKPAAAQPNWGNVPSARLELRQAIDSQVGSGIQATEGLKPVAYALLSDGPYSVLTGQYYHGSAGVGEGRVVLWAATGHQNPGSTYFIRSGVPAGGLFAEDFAVFGDQKFAVSRRHTNEIFVCPNINLVRNLSGSTIDDPNLNCMSVGPAEPSAWLGAASGASLSVLDYNFGQSFEIIEITSGAHAGKTLLIASVVYRADYTDPSAATYDQPTLQVFDISELLISGAVEFLGEYDLPFLLTDASHRESFTSSLFGSSITQINDLLNQSGTQGSDGIAELLVGSPGFKNFFSGVETGAAFVMNVNPSPAPGTSPLSVGPEHSIFPPVSSPALVASQYGFALSADPTDPRFVAITAPHATTSTGVTQAGVIQVLQFVSAPNPQWQVKATLENGAQNGLHDNSFFGLHIDTVRVTGQTDSWIYASGRMQGAEPRMEIGTLTQGSGVNYFFGSGRFLSFDNTDWAPQPGWILGDARGFGVSLRARNASAVSGPDTRVGEKFLFVEGGSRSGTEPQSIVREFSFVPYAPESGSPHRSGWSRERCSDDPTIHGATLQIEAGTFRTGSNPVLTVEYQGPSGAVTVPATIHVGIAGPETLMGPGSSCMSVTIPLIGQSYSATTNQPYSLPVVPFEYGGLYLSIFAVVDDPAAPAGIQTISDTIEVKYR